MDKVAVDPKLFITCRLCLEDMGLYQIVPAVQKQIKFCFDIEVAPFDGLPQLICKKCEAILSEYYKVKNSFLEKQNCLKVKLSLENENLTSLQESCSKSQEEMCSLRAGINLKTIKQGENRVQSKAKKRKRSSIGSISSTTTSVADIDSDDSLTKICKNPRKEGTSIMNKNYKKIFICKFCSQFFPNKFFLLEHSLTHHSKIKRKFSDVFKYFCVVKMNKIDDHKGCSFKNEVQYSQSQFIQHVNDINYYIIYTAKNKKTVSNRIESSDSDNEVLIKRENRKPLRLLSRSESNETVVIPNKCDNNNSSSDFEEEKNKTVDSKSKNQVCINIDSESSESNSEASNVVSNTIDDAKDTNDDHKTIQNIIEICYNKYTKRVTDYSKKSDLKSHIQHKFLSIGRKIINKQGFNCTGLLRFMEHQNLDITWQPKGSTSTYVRILTKIKDCQKENGIDFVWINETGVFPEQETTPHTIIPISSSNSSINHSQEQISITMPVGNQAVLYTTSADLEANSTSKLLNASPVANPKQLPKKNTVAEIKPNNNVTDNNVRNEDNDDTIFIELDDEVPDGNLCMPVITSTTSLACQGDNQINDPAANNPVSTNLQSNKNVNEVSTPTPAPRIKVKPVSELMPVNVTRNVTQQNTIGNKSWHLNQNLQNCVNQNVNVPYENMNNVYVLNTAEIQNLNKAPNVSMLQIANASTPSVESNIDERPKIVNDYIILDTVEMPNTKTYSPFKYFKTLLQMHNILLLDSRNEINQHFYCLIKFKVVFKQDNVKPVILCLSLHCLQNIFYIDIKDGGRMHIDMVKISANWQWEIIKIYQGDVVNKILFNSQKISAEVHEITKRFLCLLKSINYKKDVS
ncbi:uncharacterized protein LOC116413655 [Galleria mellonella]|uniref:Uncharacterized protein LOC116413655 n=1 Tax=Galleria mellonella TaxID=7137 RepID=A0ABM3MQY9_GALME|nr:uncharacterized protein LOC116413655 [Galleria mellonella]